MITKKSIAEQVQRIVNGGSSSDDSKVTLQEVIALVEQERDAMVKKHILENSVIGEHEIPSAFLTKRKFDVALSSEVLSCRFCLGCPTLCMYSMFILPHRRWR